MRLPHRKKFDLAVPTLLVDVPTDVGPELATVRLRDRHMLSVLWAMEFRYGLSVVVGPVSVLMLIDRGWNHGAEALLEERVVRAVRGPPTRG